MFRKKTPMETPPDKVDTIIGKDTIFKGTLKAKGLIRIDGEMEGEIDTQGDVVIGESGKVNLELRARHVAVAGRFEGNLYAEGKLEVKSSGTVIGEVEANGLLVDDGAVLSGSMQMKQQDQRDKQLPKGNGTANSPGKG